MLQGWDYRDHGWDLRASICGWTQCYQQLSPEDHQGACNSNIWNSKLGLTAGKAQKLLDYTKHRGEADEPAHLDNKRLSQLFSEMVHAVSLDSAGCSTTSGGSNVSWSAKEICIFLLACLGFTWKADILGQIFENEDDGDDDDDNDNDNEDEDEEDQADVIRQPINKVNPIIYVYLLAGWYVECAIIFIVHSTFQPPKRYELSTSCTGLFYTTYNHTQDLSHPMLAMFDLFLDKHCPRKVSAQLLNKFICRVFSFTFSSILSFNCAKTRCEGISK